MSLVCQTHQNFEIIVVDNATDRARQLENARVVNIVKQRTQNPVRHEHTIGPTCYHSSEHGAYIAEGEYICFPSDDSYYVPPFADRLLWAARNFDWQLVLCQMTYGNRRDDGAYHTVSNPEPRLGSTDKTAFILRRDRFVPFPQKPDIDIPFGCDGFLMDELQSSGIRWGLVPQYLLVHN